MDSKQKILLLDVLTERFMESISGLLPRDFELIGVETQNEEERIDKVKDADYIITIGTPVSAKVIEAGEKLKLIQKSGVGYDNINLDAASDANVPVAITAGANAISVSEHVFMMILTLYRNLSESQRIAQEGNFVRKWTLVNDSFELFGKTVGIVGLGHVGRQVAKRAKCFGVRTIYYDKYYRPSARDEEDLGIEFVSFEDVLRLSDVVSLHVPLTDETAKMMGTKEFTMMKRSAVLINTARGGVVNEVELIEALKNKLIAGTGLDVFDPEPPHPDNPLLHMRNVVVSPHSAAVVIESEKRCIAHSLRNIARLANGEPIRYIDVIVSTPELKVEPSPIVW